jgi:hypothetical protein
MSDGIDPAHANRSAAWLQVAGEHAQRGALARAVRPEEANDLALVDGEAQAFDGDSVTVLLGEILDFDHVGGLPRRALGQRFDACR